LVARGAGLGAWTAGPGAGCAGRGAGLGAWRGGGGGGGGAGGAGRRPGMRMTCPGVTLLGTAILL
jgi:hypothetical protein